MRGMMTRTRLTLISLATALLNCACHTGGLRNSVWEGPVTQQDSVVLAQRILWDLVQRLDSMGRTPAGLPATLRPLLDSTGAGGTDPWARTIRYTPQGLSFEVRSSGSDGVLQNENDVIALGRVGRSLPCETRDQYGARHYENIVAPCSASPPLVLPLCPSLIKLEPSEQAGPTARDSVLATGRRLLRFARIIDGVGRERGGLPASLRAVPGQPRLAEWEIPDAWARSVSYVAQGQHFELRSPGSDGKFQTGDDIHVTGQLGQPILCRFEAGGGTMSCDSPPPSCP